MSDRLQRDPLAFALAMHGLGVIASLREPRIFELWMLRVSLCRRIANYRYWRCNSYRG